MPVNFCGPPPIAKAISSKSRRFGRNPMRLKSLALKLDDHQSSCEYELANDPAGAPVGTFGWPLGFDGHFAKGGWLPYEPSAEWEGGFSAKA